MLEKNGLKHIYDINLFNIDDFDVLLHEILKHAKMLVGAEAGTIYIKDEDALAFNVFQNDALSYEKIYQCYSNLKDVRLPLSQSSKYLAVESFVLKKIIMVNDVYNNTHYDFEGVKEFDVRFNYHTMSMITIPLIHPIENSVLGVLQLLNKTVNGVHVAFDTRDKEILTMAGSFIAISILKAQSDIERLELLNRKLEDANRYLEEKIQVEMDKNEKKNAIIFHQSKLISMGEMIGNIAHQWRQPLSAISSASSGLALSIDLQNLDLDEAKDKLKYIVKTTQYLSHTIEDFRSFYSVEKINTYFNLSKTIKKAVNIFNAALKSHNITIVYDCDESLEYYGLQNEFTQAVLNLISNSKDALEANLKMNDKRFIFISLYQEDNVSVLHFKDNANGIDSALISKIFDQHFTTKGSKKGTGLGLFMTHEIITNHMSSSIEVKNSAFTYENEHYKGAEFIIRLKPSTPNSNKIQ